MKRLVLFTLIFLTSVSAWSQDKKYDWGVSFKSLFLDYQSQNGGSVDAIRNYHHGFEIGLHKKLQDNIFLNVPFKYGNVNATNIENNDLLHKRVVGLDAQVQYQFQKPDAKIVPYFLGGLGAVLEFEGDFNVQAPLGIGLFFKAAPNAYVNWQSEYRFSFAENRNNLHHGIGFVYLLGPDGETEEIKEDIKDMDGDGIANDLDLCPDIPGLKSLNGCPDSDGDGIADYQDKCPNAVGSKETMGCPDTDGDGVHDGDDLCKEDVGTIENNGCPEKVEDRDGDGVPDNVDACPDIKGDSVTGCPQDDNDMDGVPNSLDKCPDVKGSAATDGCPDSDGDGVADKDDKCPNAAGPKVYNGCPDTDGDGLDDSIDKCPNSPGTVASNGCPDITKEDRETLDIAMRAVQFDTGKNTFKSESYQILKQIAAIMNKYPDYNLSISGHTDNVGNAPANQTLSERRAQACYTYLISQGILASRMSHAGYGESRPVADNNTLNGKKLNRRVEFTLIPR